MADYKHPGRNNRRSTRGQALVEYVLIVTLVSLAIIAILTATGPAIGNVFSNTVYNLLNQTQTPRDTLNAQEIVNYSTAYASYTPPAIVVPTNTPPGVDPNAEKPPKCSPPNPAFSMTIPPDTVLNVPAALGLLHWCKDDNPSDVLVVKSFEQPTKGLVSVPDFSTGAFTYDPQGFLGPYAYFTYVVTDNRGGEATGWISIGINTNSPVPSTNTPTPQPPATPVDVQFPYPFSDRGDVPTNWQSGFPNVLYGPWSIEYYNTPDLSGTKVAVGSAFWKNGVETLNYDWGSNPPVAGVTVPIFSIKYTAENVSIEPRAYQIMLSASGEAELFIDGASYITANNEIRVKDYNAPESPTQHNVVLTFKHTAAGPASLRLNFNKLADKLTKADLATSPDCKWATHNSSYHSEYSAWQDSGPSGDYVANTVCNLRLRGFISLPSGASKPQLAFWDHWDTNTLDELVVGVRDYKSTNPWTWVTVHPAGAKNLNWKREAFDLTDFGAAPSNPGSGVDFRGKSIELAFKVVSDDLFTAEGWYIDDITVDDNTPRIYTVGFHDDSENNQISSQNWRNECNWQRTMNDKHGGNFAWASNPPTAQNPSATYSNNDDCSLTLNGLVDLTSYAGSSAQPELAFWSKAMLTATTDLVDVEWAPEDSSVWTALKPKGSSDAFVAKATADTDWREVVVDLNAQRGQRFQLRLRLLADSDNNVAQGWYVDDIALREHSIITVGVPFLEPFDNLDRWQVAGTWGLTTGTDPAHYSAPTALTDSPAGMYPSTINTAAELIPSIDLAGTAHPVLTFWTFWNADANLYVDISKDEGVSWDTPVWQKVNSAGFDGIPTQLAWQRVKIDLSGYVEVKATQSGTVRVRFRLVSAGGASMDGWYIDDLAVQEDDFSAVKVSNGTYLDNIDSADTPNNWLPGGTWKITSGQGKDASQGWSDSPTDYPKPARSELEFKQAIDLSGTTKPTLYFWMKYMLGDPADHLYVDYSKDNGFTWVAISATSWARPNDDYTEQANLGWHRALIDLTSFKPASASDLPIRLRFRLEATNANTSADGWYIDNFTLFDRINLNSLGSTFDDNFTDFANWVVEGDWTEVPNLYGGWTYQPTSFVPTAKNYTTGTQTVFTSNWVGDYWHIAPTHTEVWGASGVTWPTTLPNIPLDNSPAEINFDYSINPLNLPYANSVPQWTDPGAANYEYYLMRWQRQYTVATPGTYLMRLRFAGGARLYIDNVLKTPITSLGKPFQTVGGDVSGDPFKVASALRSYYYEIPNLSGTFTIRIEYFHKGASSGPGKIEFAVSEKSTVARTSSGTSTYPVKYRTSIILDGLLTIPANKVGAVSYQERYSFTDNGSGRVYYSTDEGLKWTEVTGVRRDPNNAQGGSWTVGSMQDWVSTSFYITNNNAVFSTATRVMIKFELYSAVATVGDEGWLIDNFKFFGSDLVPNTAPVSSNAVFVGTTSPANGPQTYCVNPMVVDNAGDTWTFAPVASALPVRGTASGNSSHQLCYRPPDEWTGETSFVYQVTDSASQTVNGTATVVINPYFFRGVNVGRNTTTSPSVTINGNVWDAWGTSGAQDSTTWISDNTLTPIPSADANTTSMLRTWREWNGGSPYVAITNMNDPGVYSFYVWVVESGATPQVYDIYPEGTDRMRIVNNYNSGSRGTWSRLGPFTIINPGSLRIYAVNGTARVAGIETWRGDTYNQWTLADIGGTNITGKGTPASGAGPTIDIQGSGSDIWGTADRFRYAYNVEVGDVEIIARVRWNSSPPDSWSKAGLMIRSTDAAGSKQAMVVLTRDNGISFQWRPGTDNDMGNVCTNNVPSPNACQYAVGSIDETQSWWLKLTKTGNDFRAYYSADNVTWTQIGGSDYRKNFSIGARYMIGLAVTSHSDGNFADAHFEDVQIIQK